MIETAINETKLVESDDAPLSLGALIDALERSLTLPVAEYVGDPARRSVYFDWCQRTPDGIDSYRGIYSELALGIGDAEVLVGDFLKDCKSALGQTYNGYKGGLYTMSKDTQIWVANYGQSHQWGVCGVNCDEWKVELQTKYFGYL
jgi:hypothetical protein